MADDAAFEEIELEGLEPSADHGPAEETEPQETDVPPADDREKVEVKVDADQFIKLQELKLERAKHDFEVDKWIIEGRHMRQAREIYSSNQVFDKRLETVYAALSVYRAGMGENHKPHTIDNLISEFTQVFNAVYSLCRPMEPQEKESLDDRADEAS